MKKLAIIHTTPSTISSLASICAEQLPGITTHNLLDDSILPQINAEGHISPAVSARFHLLCCCAIDMQADAILCACSSVGGLLDDNSSFLPIPTLRIDAPMAKQAIHAGKHITVAATLASTLDPTISLIQKTAKEADVSVNIKPLLIQEAGPLLAAGKTAEYEALIVEKLSTSQANSDVIVLAQASMAGAAAQLPSSGIPILSSPQSGIAALRPILGIF